MAEYNDTAYNNLQAASLNQAQLAANVTTSSYGSYINTAVTNGTISGSFYYSPIEKDPVDVLSQAIIEPILSNEIFIMTDVTRELTKHCGHIFTEDIVAIYKPKYQVDQSDVVIIDDNTNQLVLNSDYLFNGEWLCFTKEVAFPLEMAYKIRPVPYYDQNIIMNPQGQWANYLGQYTTTINTTPYFGTSNPPPNYWYSSPAVINGIATNGVPAAGLGIVASGTTTTNTVI